jgi:uncharacterized lipoprotein YajG
MTFTRIKFSLIFTVLAILTLTGCAPGPQMLSVRPDVAMPAGDGIAELTLGVEIIDALGSQKIGISGNPNGDNFPITLKGDVASALAPSIQEGLENQGFKVVPPSKETPNTLTVEIRKISLNSVKEKTMYVTSVDVEIAAKAKNGRHEYVRRYSSFNSKEDISVSSMKNSELLLNSALSEQISLMLNDEKLIETLKK